MAFKELMCFMRSHTTYRVPGTYGNGTGKFIFKLPQGCNFSLRAVPSKRIEAGRVMFRLVGGSRSVELAG